MGASSAGLPCLEQRGASGDSDGLEGLNHNLGSFNKTIIKYNTHMCFWMFFLSRISVTIMHQKSQPLLTKRSPWMKKWSSSTTSPVLISLPIQECPAGGFVRI